VGATVEYHFDGTSTAAIAALAWTWDRDRLELAAFRFLDAQVRYRLALANPNWTYEVSRRWSFLGTSRAMMFFGIGGAYKSETDDINGSRLNFAEQLGWRFTRSEGGAGFEVVVRHMSNAGLVNEPGLAETTKIEDFA
jgi:Lipid A 3-O-deacylase (PagL)